MINSYGKFLDNEDSFEITITRKRKRQASTRHYEKRRDQSVQDEDNYGYVGAEEIIEVEEEIYKQRTPTLDLPSVIKAVNGL